MSLPDSAAALFVLVLGLLPGIPGDRVYEMIVGASWREKEWKRLLRILTFSLLGLAGYAILSGHLDWYLPTYVIPATFSSSEFEATILPALSKAYLGHFMVSTLVGALTAAAVRTLGRVSSAGLCRDAWDQFVNYAVPEHWVLVSLRNGETYAGMLDHADVAVEPKHRDLILGEPFRFSSDGADFVPTYNQSLFIRGEDVGSISVVYDREKDSRVVPVGGNPFAQEVQNG